MTDLPRYLGYDRGVHLKGSALWFDAQRPREFCVHTGVLGKLPGRHHRAVAAEPLAKALKAGGLRTSLLPTPVERWVGIGGFQMYFSDSGLLASSPVCVRARGKRILFLGCPGRGDFSLPPADFIVATTPALRHRGADLGRTVKALGLFIEQALADGVRATVLVDCLDVGIALERQLRNAGHAPQTLGLLAKLIPTPRRPQLRLAPAGSRISHAGRVARIDSGLGAFRESAAAHGPSDMTLRLRWFAGIAELRDVITSTGAAEIALIGAPAQSALAELPATVHRFDQATQLNLPRGV